MITAIEVCRVLALGRFDLNNETATQAAIDAFLRERLPDVKIEREFSLSPKDRPDFLIDGRIVVEVKIRGARKREVWDQLLRYAKHDRVTDLVLVTNLSMGLPATANGKDTRYVSLGRAWL